MEPTFAGLIRAENNDVRIAYFDRGCLSFVQIELAAACDLGDDG